SFPTRRSSDLMDKRLNDLYIVLALLRICLRKNGQRRQHQNNGKIKPHDMSFYNQTIGAPKGLKSPTTYKAKIAPQRMRFYNVLILVFIKKEVIFGRIVRPNLFDVLIRFTIVFQRLKILDHLHWSTRTNSIIDQFIFS